MKKKPTFPVKDFWLKGGRVSKRKIQQVVRKYLKDHPELKGK